MKKIENEGQFHAYLKLAFRDQLDLDTETAAFLNLKPKEEFPQKNVITRAIGGDDELILDIGYFDIQAGDRFLLCSDGLTDLVLDEKIETSLISTFAFAFR